MYHYHDNIVKRCIEYMIYALKFKYLVNCLLSILSVHQQKDIVIVQILFSDIEVLYYEIQYHINMMCDYASL